MQQGSEVVSKTPQHPTELATTLVIQRRSVVALKEVSSLCSGMQHIALYCIDQGHVTIEHMEEMVDILGLLRRQLDALRIEIASH